jgi:hypothetical protein
MGVPLDPEVLYYGGTFRSSRPILRRYLRFSSAVLWRHPEALKAYIMGVPLGPLVLYSGGTLRSSGAIFWGYP